MANSANPEINKKIATSALGTLVIATVFFYLGDRYAETLVTYPGQIFDHLSDAFLSMWQTIKDAPFALDMTSNSLLFGGACFLIIWMIWLRYVAFIGNYRSGEESGSARWGTLKEGKKFKDLQTEDNNLLFTKNFGLALHRPKFDPEYDRNLNVLVVGGSGSGKTFNYVTPNICQLNTSYFVTDPKGTLLKDAGYLFTDNGYKLKSFNTINLDESMHYNPLKYVKTDTDILSFVNCFIMNTNPEGKSSGDPFWENAEKMLYTALIALLRDWFPAKDYNMSSLLTLLSLAETLWSRRPHPSVPRGTPMTIRSCRRVSLLSSSCKETLTSGTCATRWRILISTVTSPKRSAKLPSIRSMTTTMPFSRGFPTTRSGWNKPSSTAFPKAARAISTRWFRWRSTSTSSPTSTTIARISAVTAPSTS